MKIVGMRNSYIESGYNVGIYNIAKYITGQARCNMRPPL